MEYGNDSERRREDLEETLLSQHAEEEVEPSAPDTTSNPTAVTPFSRNVPLMLGYAFSRCAAESIWLGSVLSAYVYLIRPDNPETVGYLSAVEGITQFIVACVAGILGDMYRRDVLLRFSSLLGMLASILIVVAVTKHVFVCLVLALILNGAFDGIGLTAGLALYADSIEEGKRSHYFTKRTLCFTIGQFFGPMVALLLFVILGNLWTVGACAAVMSVAQFLLVPNFVILWLFRDVDRQSQQEGDDSEREPSVAAPLLRVDAGEEERESQLSLDGTPASDTAIDYDSSVRVSLDLLCGIPKSRWIAMSAAASDIIGAFASGISYRYFAIFFLKDLHFGPVLVQILDALSCLLGGGLLVLAQRVSLRYNRSPTSVFFKMVGTVFLVAMNCWFQYMESQVHSHPQQQVRVNHVVICVLYLLQNGFLNSTQALTRSLIMDNVPSRERARWSALESVNIFGWCGSAALGGILVKWFHGDVLPVFYLTAVLQVVASMPLVTLFRFDTREHHEQG